ncbi:hypothetical protein [Mycobacteroides abscessus]|uniref:hypothetical protein n=1 Tax=Mycobacteroides abscessus TaxID=36809 RepID=UPI000929D59D|nr:hypothetical protein [Mycobacteroides abscessus]MBN7371109.1 hypothetical protein [Mycobacteroides abscessus subsp. abscessus]MBN7522618.1 hypothetical protein [Mycobacteroides abscessus subsp. abscessus]MDB2185155.1 hypothetical protein [Mycobacteroides abscessus subsp. abscessus]MDO3123492.1 hypothetical protein [Mycobacteroides abscessus subsp. abscessus]MDO3173303.1 hypothetical protein [Mycobacteroides abscessus subsp. abscessus]
MSAANRAAEAYLAAHPGNTAGAAVAGYIAALRVARAADPHAFPTQSPDVRAAMRLVDLSPVEAWVDANWTEIEEAA